MISLATRLRAGSSPRCPYCHDHLGQAQAAITCPGCETRHHAECVREVGTCTTYGCGERLSPGEAPLDLAVREQIRARIRAGMARYARDVGAMERPETPVGREQRWDSPGFKLADNAARNPELVVFGSIALLLLLIAAPCIVASILY